jgi:hypothetical protein
MRVQNRVYAGTAVSVRTASYDGDADGVFDMADEHAAMVLTMQGWAKATTKSAKPIVAAPIVAAPVAAEPAAVEVEAEPAVEAVEGPDLQAITTKAEMLRVAAQYNVDLSSAQRRLSVDELRVIVDAAIYGAVEVVS